MGLLDLFRPRWKHSDAAVRMEAVKDLTPDDIVELGQVAKRDKDVRVRRLALKKISDLSLLSEMAENDGDESLRKEAAEKRGALLLSSAVSDEDESTSLDAVAQLSPRRLLVEAVCRATFPSVRQAGLERLTDGPSLVEVIKKSKDAQIRKQALEAIADNDEALLDLACSDGNKDLLLQSLEKITDPELLHHIVQRAKSKPVRQAAIQRLPASEVPTKTAVAKSDKTPRPAVVQAVDPVLVEREDLCRKLEAATKTEDFEAADEFLAGLRKRWGELGTLPNGHALAKRFERAATRYNERKEVFQKKLAARNAGHREATQSAAALALAERMERLEKEEALAKQHAEEKRKERLAREAEEQQKEAERRSAYEEKMRSEREQQRQARQAERDAELLQETEKRNAREQKRTEDQEKNLTKLNALSEKLLEMAGRENLTLKQAEQALKDAQQAVSQWTSLPTEKRRDARREYDEARSKLVIRVQALREQLDWERWSNLPRLEALCAQVEELLQVVKTDADIDFQAAADHLKKLQSEWKSVGPAPKEKSETLWQRFKTGADLVFEHLRSVGAAEREQAMAAREALIEKISALVASETVDFQAAFQTVRGWQTEWKQLPPIPRASRDLIETVRSRFHTACDAFYEKRKAYLASIGQSPEDNLRKKEELCSRLERLANSSDMQAATEILRRCQADWKLIGPAPKEQDREIWQRFRKAGDAFFARRKAMYEKREGEWLTNQKKKEEVCTKAETLANREDIPQDTAETELKQLMAEWRRTGPAPKKAQDELWKRFRAACDKVFSAGRDVTIPAEGADGKKFENRPLGALLSQLQAEHETSAKQTAEETTASDPGPDPHSTAPDSNAAPTASAVSPSQISDGWARTATSEWNEIEEIISSGQTPTPDEDKTHETAETPKT